MKKITRLSLSRKVQKSSICTGLYFSFAKSKVSIRRSNGRNSMCFVLLYDTMVSWNQEEIVNIFCTFLYNTEVSSKERLKCVWILYFTSMEARGKIYIISHITGMLRYFRHGQIILKITLWRMMMRAREENSSTHSKKRLGTHVGSRGNEIKTNVSVRTKAKNWRLSFSTWMRAHVLRWEIRTGYETGGTIRRKLKCDLSEMNDYLWPRETLRY